MNNMTQVIELRLYINPISEEESLLQRKPVKHPGGKQATHLYRCQVNHQTQKLLDNDFMDLPWPELFTVRFVLLGLSFNIFTGGSSVNGRADVRSGPPHTHTHTHIQTPKSDTRILLHPSKQINMSNATSAEILCLGSSRNLSTKTFSILVTFCHFVNFCQAEIF